MTFLLVSVGCAMPVMHPFRTHEGPGARAAVVVHVGAENEASCNNDPGCSPGDVSGFSPLNVDGRWGHMLGEHVGVMGGASFPGFENNKTGSGYGALLGYGVVTVQGDVLSVGAGPEVGSHVAGASGGVDFELVPLFGVDLPDHLIAVSAYGRYLRPYSVEEAPVDGRVPSWDVGASLRIGPVVAQYAYYRQTSGVMEYVIYESSVQAQSWHMFTLAAEVNADTLDFETPSDRERERLRRQLVEQQEQERKRKQEWERRHPRAVREAWPGCEALCAAQAPLHCGVEQPACLERCKQRRVPAACWDEDDAVMRCQARGVRCELGRLWLPACAPQRDALDRCLATEGIAGMMR